MALFDRTDNIDSCSRCLYGKEVLVHVNEQ